MIWIGWVLIVTGLAIAAGAAWRLRSAGARPVPGNAAAPHPPEKTAAEDVAVRLSSLVREAERAEVRLRMALARADDGGKVPAAQGGEPVKAPAGPETAALQGKAGGETLRREGQALPGEAPLSPAPPPTPALQPPARPLPPKTPVPSWQEQAVAMAAAGRNEAEISRALRIGREEVRLVLQMARYQQSPFPARAKEETRRT